jgi:hypothetical protein
VLSKSKLQIFQSACLARSHNVTVSNMVSREICHASRSVLLFELSPKWCQWETIQPSNTPCCHPDARVIMSRHNLFLSSRFDIPCAKALADVVQHLLFSLETTMQVSIKILQTRSRQQASGYDAMWHSSSHPWHTVVHTSWHTCPSLKMMSRGTPHWHLTATEALSVGAAA